MPITYMLIFKVPIEKKLIYYILNVLAAENTLGKIHETSHSGSTVY